MRAALPTEEEWIELGAHSRRIRDAILRAYTLTSSIFRIKAKQATAFRRLHDAFWSYRSSLDDFLCGCYPLSQSRIGVEQIRIVNVFCGGEQGLVGHDRGDKTNRFTGVELLSMQRLCDDVMAFMAAINMQPWIKRQFVGYHNQVPQKLKRCVERLKAVLV